MNLKNFINVAVIGVGAFGRNHARVYQQLAQQGETVRLVGVVDADLARADAVAREFGCRGFGSIEQLTTTHSEVQAASVVVPTFQHFQIARALMESGVDVLIEKQVTASLDEADQLIRLAQRLGRIAQVGHLERFNPAIRATLSLITHPMFFEVHRLSRFTPRSLDIDVVLDLMIHDLDVVLTFVNSPIKEIRAVGLPILSEKADIANVRMEFESGCVANFTASRVSTERVRKLRFFQPKQYISIDYTRQDVLVFSVDDHESAGDPSVKDPSETAWHKALDHIKRAHNELVNSVKMFPESRLSERVPGKTHDYYDFYYMFSGIVQHELYHAGQIALLKKFKR